MAIFLISVVLVIFVVLWRNGFFKGFLSDSDKATKHSKEAVGPSAKEEIEEADKPLLPRAKSAIPRWYSMWTACWAQATPQHRQFYWYWLGQLEKGNFIDIEENPGYVFIHMKSVINQFRKSKDIDYLRRCFEKIESGYGQDRNVHLFLRGWLLHAYLFLENYDGAWGVMKDMGFYDYLDISDIVFLNNKCGSLLIDGQTLVSILKDDTGLTEIGEEHRKEIADLATSFLNSFQEKHGRNLIKYLHEQFASANTVEVEHKRDSTRVVTLFGHPSPRICPRGQRLLSLDYCSQVSNLTISKGQEIGYPAVPLSTQEAINAVLKKLLRECENVVREERGLPRVGEGWVSETKLFKELCEVFPNERVIQHAQPAWLGQQHLDVYFPSRNAAIEYQGAQHQRPVGFFGGEKTFENQQERDRKKRQLCEKYKCRLIYAYPDYSISDIERQIRGDSSYNPPVLRNEAASTDRLRKDLSGGESTNRQQISVSIPPEILSEQPIERLGRLANRHDRSVNYLVVKAILQYLDREEGLEDQRG